MKAYRGSFIKKDGSLREMVFAKLEDLDDSLLQSMIKGTGSPKKLGEGQELVMDLEEENFRIFNWNTVVDIPVEIDLD